MAQSKFGSRFLTVLYPDSLPDEWLKFIEDLHVPALLSPLHCPVSDDGEEQKKPHYHLLLDFGSNAKKTLEQIDSLLKPLNCTRCQFCIVLKGSVRYFLHLDSPLKEQFSDGVNALTCFSGFDPMPFIEPELSDKAISAIIHEIKQFCVDNNIKEFLDLSVYAFNIPDWDYVLNTCNCYSIYKLIDSIRHYHNQYEDLPN